MQQRSADVTALCWAEAGLVDVRTRRGDTAEALDTLRQTLEIASANDLRLAQAAMCATLMTVHAITAERGAVEEVYRAGVELCREQADDRVVIELHASAAELRALRGEIATAHDALRSAEALASSSAGPLSAIRAALARGTVAEAEQHLDVAAGAYRGARAAAETIGARYLAAKATLLLSAIEDDPPAVAAALKTSCSFVRPSPTRCASGSAISSSTSMRRRRSPSSCNRYPSLPPARRSRPPARRRRASRHSSSVRSSCARAARGSATAAGARTRRRSCSRSCCLTVSVWCRAMS